MPEISRFSECMDWIDLNFVERQRIPECAMKLGIQLQLAGLSLSNAVTILEELGVERSRKAIYDWVQKADLQPSEDRNPNHVVVDETVIRINDQQFRLYATADPDTNNLLHLRLFSTTTIALTEIFLRELRQKHNVESAVFLVNGAQHHQTALARARLRFQIERNGNRNAIERIFQVFKRRTSSFSNCFSTYSLKLLKIAPSICCLAQCSKLNTTADYGRVNFGVSCAGRRGLGATILLSAGRYD